MSPPIRIDAAFMQHLDYLETPVWIFDIEQEAMFWANPPAVKLWGADSKACLLARNFADMTDATRTRLNGYLDGFKEGQRFVERWSFYPEDSPVTVDCSCSGVYLPDSRLAMLVEGRAVQPLEIKADTLLMTEALRHTNTMVSVFTLEGKPLFRNPSATRAYGETATQKSLLWDIPTDEDSRHALRQALENDQVFSAQLYVKTMSGQRWHGLDVRKIKDPITGDTRILVNERDNTDQHLAEEALRLNEARLEGLFNLSPVGIALSDYETGTFLRVNNALTAAIDYTQEECQTLSIWDVTPDKYAAEEALKLENLRNQGYFAPYEKEYIRKDGSQFPVQVKGMLLKDPSGRELIWSIIEDMTSRKQSEEKLKLAANVFTHSHEGIIITDANAKIVDVNDAFTLLTGYAREDAIARDPSILRSGMQEPSFYAEMWQRLKEKGHWHGEIWNKKKDSSIFAGMLTISSVHDQSGEVRNYVGLFTDITAQKKYQSQLEHLAHYDALTNLPNRVLLTDRLNQALALQARNGKNLAVVYLDLDGFKAVNDTHGHNIGDQLLERLAARLTHTLRESDTVARLGGDEFVLLLNNLDHPNECYPLLKRVLDAASQPIMISGNVHLVSASLGVSFYPQSDEVGPDQLLRQADQAMYQAKLAGKNRYQIFDEQMDRDVRDRNESIKRIRQGLTENEFVLLYQPQVNLRTGSIVGAEALIRWQHPQKGMLLPNSFLPEIEDTSLAAELDEWVIGKSLRQLSYWHAQGFNIQVSVNITASYLQRTNFKDHIASLLSTHPLVKPELLMFEITESSALSEIEHVSSIIRSCSELGVRFALDDFGTGYSSLTYLKHLPADQLKIDRSFLRDMLDNPGDLAIVKAILGCSGAFRCEVIAEGVESAEQGDTLLQLGCELAQGYAFAYPMTAEELFHWNHADTPVCTAE